MNSQQPFTFPKNVGFNIFSKPLEDVLEYAASHGMTHIEINTTLPHSAPKSFTPERIARIRDFLNTHNIGLSLHLPSKINVADIIAMFRKTNIRYIRQIIELASDLTASHITTHAGNFYWFPVEKWMRQKALDRFVRSIESVQDLCRSLSVQLALENVVPLPDGSDYFYLGDTIRDFEYLFSRLDPDCVKFCLDTGHANMAEGAVEYIKHFSKQLVTVHYHDNAGDNDSHLPPGHGNLDWASITKELDRVKYSGPLISECRNIMPHESAQKLMDLWHSENP